VPKRPYLVMSSGLCVPLEGAYRIEQVDGDWYVLGRHSVVPCGSRRAAESTIEMLSHEHDAHALAREALEGLPANYQVADR